MPDTQLQPNSGRGRFRKRDARAFKNFLVERRHTEADSYRINKKEFQDIVKQGNRQPPGCKAAMSIDFNGELVLWVMTQRDYEEVEARLRVLEGD